MSKKNNLETPLKVVSLFSGIGAFEKALTNQKIPYELINYCEIDKYASTAYAAIHGVSEELNLGDISKVDFSKIPDFDLVTYGFPCFTPGTLVLTNNGYKAIEEVKVGDKVITHNNRFRNVTKVMNTHSNHYYEIKNQFSEPIHATEEHPFYVKEKINNVFSSPKWVKAKDLTTNHYISTVKINDEKHIDLSKYSFNDKEITLLKKYTSSSSFWWLIGFMINNLNKIKENKYNFNSTKNDNIINMISKKLSNLNIDYENSIKENNCVFKIKDTNFIKLFNRFIDKKHIFMNDILYLPNKYLQCLIVGKLVKDSDFKHIVSDSLKLSDKTMAYVFTQIISKSFKVDHGIKKINDNYYITFNSENRKNNIYEDGNTWTPILSIDRQDYDGEVFNLEVEEDNSYSVYNVIVHNCQDISNAGLKRGIVKDKTRSGLLFYALDLIEEKKPKYAICENVKNLVGKNFRKDFDELLYKLDELGYNNYWKVLNSKDFGIPQNRERVFVVSIRKDLEQEYTFPKNILLETELEDILEKEIDETFYLSDIGVERLLRHKNKIICNDTPKVSGCIHAGYYKMGGRDQQYIKIKKTYSFPIEQELKIKLKDILEKEVDEIYYVEQDRINHLLKELKDKNCVAVREGTIQGYSIANEGDSINTAYANSIVRRGRVGKEIANTLLTSTKICVVEKVKTPSPEKKLETILEKRIIEYAEKNNDIPDFFNAYNKREFKDISPTITTTIGSAGSISGIVKCEGIERVSDNEISNNGIITYNIPKTVRTRVYSVDKDKLNNILNYQKTKLRLSCREISRLSNCPVTLVEHWFRNDNSFSIPHPEVWEKLKSILKINENFIKEGMITLEELKELDKQITTFEEKQGNYDKANRIYDVEGNIPTLTTVCKEHTIVDLETFRIRKLTPLETWFLMGFDEEDYLKAKAALIEKHYKGKDRTNSQMYHMAGNSIVVNVLEGILSQLLIE